MLVAFIRRLGETLFARCPALRGRWGWAIIALLATALGVSLTFPDYRHQLDVFGLAPPRDHHNFLGSTRICLSEQIGNPFVGHEFSRPVSFTGHERNMTFRLSMPILGHLLGLRIGQLILLQQFCGVLFLGLVYKLAWRATGDLVCAALLPFAFALSYVGQACFFDLVPYFDGMAFCGLAVAMCFRNPAVIFLGLCFACWTDEKAAAVSPLLLMWWVVREAGPAPAVARQQVWRNPRVWAVVLAVLSYAAGHVVLARLWQYPLSPPVDWGLVRRFAARVPYFLIGLASSLKWLWLIVGGAGLAAFLSHKRWWAAAMILFVVAYLASCVLVADITRSAAYVFPSVILGLAWLSRTESPRTVRWLLFGICVLSLLTPWAFAIGSEVLIFPMPPAWPAFVVSGGVLSAQPMGW
jgi:hypothetical protein